MLKSITKNKFDVVAGVTIIAAGFYLAAITHIVPLPENALKLISEVSLAVMNILVASVTWLVSFLP